MRRHIAAAGTAFMRHHIAAAGTAFCGVSSPAGVMPYAASHRLRALCLMRLHTACCRSRLAGERVGSVTSQRVADRIRQQAGSYRSGHPPDVSAALRNVTLPAGSTVFCGVPSHAGSAAFLRHHTVCGRYALCGFTPHVVGAGLLANASGQSPHSEWQTGFASKPAPTEVGPNRCESASESRGYAANPIYKSFRPHHWATNFVVT